MASVPERLAWVAPVSALRRRRAPLAAQEQRINTEKQKKLAEERDRVIERIALHDSGLAYRFRAGADRKLKLGHGDAPGWLQGVIHQLAEKFALLPGVPTPQP